MLWDKLEGNYQFCIAFLHFLCFFLLFFFFLFFSIFNFYLFFDCFIIFLNNVITRPPSPLTAVKFKNQVKHTVKQIQWNIMLTQIVHYTKIPRVIKIRSSPHISLLMESNFLAKINSWVDASYLGVKSSKQEGVKKSYWPILDRKQGYNPLIKVCNYKTKF